MRMQVEVKFNLPLMQPKRDAQSEPTDGRHRSAEPWLCAAVKYKQYCHHDTVSSLKLKVDQETLR